MSIFSTLSHWFIKIISHFSCQKPSKNRFNVAFQCKRYAEAVGASAIRDFRGSLTTDIEKGIFITTGTFTKAAIDEASKPGKKQIDLINGEQFMDKLAEYGLGLKEFKDYEIDEVFFKNC